MDTNNKKIIFSFIKTGLCLLLIILNLSTGLFGQNGQRQYLVNDPTTISLPTDEANSVKMKDMVGINENGYVFWDWVYKSTDPLPNVVNTSVANSFSSTFSKMRIFHLSQKDYNLGINSNTSPNTPANYTPVISPCTQGAPDPNRDFMCANRDFYKSLKQDYPFIASASSAIINDFPNGWFTYDQWGGAANAEQEAFEYILAYLETMDPDKDIATALVDRFYISNEAWGNLIGPEGYKKVSDGFIKGFTQYYQGNSSLTPDQSQWEIKVYLGAFQAHDNSDSPGDVGVWGGDFVADMLSDKAIEAGVGLDVHPYGFIQNSPYNNDDKLTEHPESVISYFHSIKSMVEWRDNQTNGMQNSPISVTEFGWNSDDIWERGTTVINGELNYLILSKSGGFSTMSNYPQDTTDWKIFRPGIGQEAQAVYTTRAYLMMARYGVESAYIYAALNNNETKYQSCGVYDIDADIYVVPGGGGKFRFTYDPREPAEFLGEKKIMPAMRKLQDPSIIGDKNYLETLIEDDNGAYAYLVGDGAGNPTHLVAWHATNITKKNETEINALTINRTLAQINFTQTGLNIETGQNYTKLDWNDSQTNNVPVASVFSNGTLTLSPIPIVIPVSGGGGECEATIPGFVKLDEFNGHGYYKSTGTSTGWNNAQTLCEAEDGDLVSIEDQAEKNFIDGFISGNSGDQSYYIGLNRVSGTLVWTSGQNYNDNNYSPSPWGSGSTPSSGGYVSLTKWGTGQNVNWSTGASGAYRKFIMEKTCDDNPGPCDNLGGDTDGDGVCDDNDCQPTDPFYPATPGATCDDGDSNTENDEVQPDGCSCAGDIITGGECEATIPGFVKLDEFNGHGYYKSTGNSTGWNNAQTLCEAEDGDLVSIEDQAEKNFIDGFISGNSGDQSYYIGLNRVSGTLVWTSGQNYNDNNYSPSPWGSGSTPSSGGYVSLTKWGPGQNVNWSTGASGAYRKFIMEKTCDDNPGPCDNLGGDTDGDGVCDDNDCQPTDPFYPATPGATCDDGDANTENDEVQPDGCSCAGDIISGNECDNVNISTGNGSITISNLSTPIAIVKIFNPNWSTLFSCSGSSCPDPIVETGLAAGTYYIKIDLYDASWGFICQRDEYVTVTTSGNFIAPDQGNTSNEDRGTFNQDENINLFPNPTDGKINVLIKDFAGMEGTIEIYNSFGQKLIGKSYLSLPAVPLEFDLGNYKAGIYMISVKAKDRKTVTKKFVVARL